MLSQKGPVELIKWVKIALLFLHVTSKLFQFTILVWVVLHPSVKEFFKTTYKQQQNNDVLFIESF